MFGFPEVLPELTEAYNLLIVSGEDTDGNDIISNYKNQVYYPICYWYI